MPGDEHKQGTISTNDEVASLIRFTFVVYQIKICLNYHEYEMKKQP